MWRTHSLAASTHGVPGEERREESRRGTQECVRHGLRCEFFFALNLSRRRRRYWGALYLKEEMADQPFARQWSATEPCFSVTSQSASPPNLQKASCRASGLLPYYRAKSDRTQWGEREYRWT